MTAASIGCPKCGSYSHLAINCPHNKAVVKCVECGTEQTHRVCAHCFQAQQASRTNEAEGMAEIIHLTLSKLPGIEITEVMENVLSGMEDPDGQGYFMDVETSGRLYHITVSPSHFE